MVFEHTTLDGILKIDVMDSVQGFSVEDSAEIMAAIIDKILQVKRVERIILAERMEHEYGFEQTRLLVEIANLFDKLVGTEIFVNPQRIGEGKCLNCLPNAEREMKLVLSMTKGDPIGAYVKARRLRRLYNTKSQSLKQNKTCKTCFKMYVDSVLTPVINSFEKTELIKLVKENVYGYPIGDRTFYRKIFSPLIRPLFMLTRYMALPPSNGRLINRYEIPGDIQIEIYKIPGEIRYFYHISPPEFRLSSERYAMLDTARRYVAEHKPGEAEIGEHETVRESFMNLGRDIIRQVASEIDIRLSTKELEQLSEILVRHTAGFGILEILLSDEQLQDIYINSPIGITPIYVLHNDFDECETNLIPTREDAERWATRFRLMSERPLDEANPVLDTELTAAGGRARVAAITRSLSPEGLAYALRRHRDRPWTYPLFINAGYFDPLFAGLMGFLVDGSRTILFAGGRSSGKTSILNSTILEIMRKNRIVVVEDTLEISVPQFRDMGYNIERMKSRSVITRVEAELPAEEALRVALRLGDSVLIIGEVRSSIRGNEEVVIVDNGETKRMPISSIERMSLENVYVPTIDNKLKMKLTKLTDFVKHPPRKKLLEIVTKTGRKVTVTHDHSVFTNTNFTIHPIETKKLKQGDKIIIPARMPCGYNNVEYLNLLDLLPNFRVVDAENYIRKAIEKLGWKKATEICELPTNDIYLYLRKKQKTRIPARKFKQLMEKAEIAYNLDDLKIKNVTSKTLPAKFPVNEDFCRLLGYYVAEGYVNKSAGIVITNSNKEIIEDISNITQKLFGIKPSIREIKGLGKSKQIRITNSPLAALVLALGCGRTSTKKRIPAIIYGLSEKKICSFLKGIYSGDGSFTSTKRAGNMVRYTTVSEKLAEDVLYLLLALGIVARIYKRKPRGMGKNDLFIVEFKQRNFVEKFIEKIGFTHKKLKMVIKAFPHTKDNSVIFDPEELERHLKLPRKYRHLRKTKKCSKYYMEKIANEVGCSKHFSDFANGEFYIDEIKQINEIGLNTPEYVYDLSVNPTENFIGGFGGIILHNTEAKALYEAMRIGALSNVVAGTIHGESAYGVFDRVVNDLGVPPTSFKATDIIVVSGMIRSADGLHRFRRVLDVVEVRKRWREDPLEEGGFVSLMEYSAKQDKLKPTETLVNGESLIINEIAKRVKEWHGRWDAVWSNIELRGKIKQAIVDYANTLKRKDILEAEWVSASNETFHLIADEVKREVGDVDSEEIFKRWDEWFRNQLKASK